MKLKITRPGVVMTLVRGFLAFGPPRLGPLVSPTLFPRGFIPGEIAPGTTGGDWAYPGPL